MCSLCPVKTYQLVVGVLSGLPGWEYPVTMPLPPPPPPHTHTHTCSTPSQCTPTWMLLFITMTLSTLITSPTPSPPPTLTSITDRWNSTHWEGECISARHFVTCTAIGFFSGFGLHPGFHHFEITVQKARNQVGGRGLGQKVYCFLWEQEALVSSKVGPTNWPWTDAHFYQE